MDAHCTNCPSVLVCVQIFPQRVHEHAISAAKKLRASGLLASHQWPDPEYFQDALVGGSSTTYTNIDQ